jgi:hypothetical protein
MSLKLKQQWFLVPLVFVAVVFLIGTAALAEDNQNPPQMQYPALYYGVVKTETGQPVASGTVKAYVDGEVCGKLPFQEGKFGLPAEDPYVARLIVYSAGEDLTGKKVTFKVESAGRECPAKTDPPEIIWKSEVKQAITLIVDESCLDGQNPPVNKLTPFSDLDGHWAEGVVSRMVYRGLISGYLDGSFYPDKPIARAECALILSRALELPAADPEELSAFGDKDAIPDWAKVAVAQAVASGLFSGYPEPDGSRDFGPKKTVNRTELAVILSRAASQKELAQKSDLANFSDLDRIPEWALEEVRAAAEYGLVHGYPDNSFRPQKEVTRAEAAAMIARLLESL